MKRSIMTALILCCVSLALALGLAGCNSHKHTLVKTEAKAATCTEDGNNAYWTCTDCHMVYSDEAATQETDEESQLLAATGHSANAETGICQSCSTQLDYLYDEATATYTVFTAQGLYVWGESRKNLILGADITLPSEMTVDLDGDGTNESNWKPAYCGTLVDGNGHSITGMTITGVDSVALLHTLNDGSTVKNLTMSDVRLEGNCGVAGITAYNGGTIINCSVSGSITATSSNVGGIAGITFDGSIIACRNEATICSDSGAVGGIVGQYNKGTVIGCYNTGSVTGDGSLGGIVGAFYEGEVTACYNTGTVTTSSNSLYTVGAFVGYGAGTLTSNYWHMSGGDPAIPGNGYWRDNENTENVDGTAITWADAMAAMNAALESAQLQWRYAANTGDDAASRPLVLESIQ